MCCQLCKKNIKYSQLITSIQEIYGEIPFIYDYNSLVICIDIQEILKFKDNKQKYQIIIAFFYNI